MLQSQFAAFLLLGATYAWKDIPGPSVGVPDDDAFWLDLPKGDWSIETAGWALVAIPDDDPVWDWAANLSDEDAWATPDGWVIVG